MFDANVVIKELKVMGGGLAGRKSLGRLGVMSELEIRSLSVQRCDRATNCGDCVALQVRFLSDFYWIFIEILKSLGRLGVMSELEI